MSTIDLVPAEIRERYEVHEWRCAAGVLKTACLSEWNDVMQALREFHFAKSEITVGGGRKSPIADKLDALFLTRGWAEKQFAVAIVVDGYTYDSPTHKVDCYKNRVALELEWNNKDPFFDRDLNNFRLLHERRAIDVGVLITRADHLDTEIFRPMGQEIAKKYGASTTHMSKLLPRIEGGGGGGCPILVFGITKRLYDRNA